jgi:hypothetical protein
MRIVVEDDPEVKVLTALVWEVSVPALSVDEYDAAVRRWGDALFQIVPASKAISICQVLVPERGAGPNSAADWLPV